MKRYEIMSREDLLKSLFDSTQGELVRVSLFRWYKYINEEVVVRIANINTIEELDKTYKEFKHFCDESHCAECEFRNASTSIRGCFYHWLETPEG